MLCTRTLFPIRPYTCSQTSSSLRVDDEVPTPEPIASSSSVLDSVPPPPPGTPAPAPSISSTAADPASDSITHSITSKSGGVASSASTSASSSNEHLVAGGLSSSFTDLYEPSSQLVSTGTVTQLIGPTGAVAPSHSSRTSVVGPAVGGAVGGLAAVAILFAIFVRPWMKRPRAVKPLSPTNAGEKIEIDKQPEPSVKTHSWATSPTLFSGKHRSQVDSKYLNMLGL